MTRRPKIGNAVRLQKLLPSRITRELIRIGIGGVEFDGDPNLAHIREASRGVGTFLRKGH